MKKLLVIFAMLVIATSSVFAAAGTMHLIYTNGQMVEEGGQSYYDFDVQAWLSEGTQVLGAGMAYVEYPISIFGDLAINNNIVTVTTTGILAGTIPEVTIELYDIFTNDTYADCYAITFDSPYMGNPDLKENFSNISIDSLQPSDLLHVRMLISGVGYGNVLFPSYIPGIDNLYFTYESETFDGGLDISEAMEVVYEDTTTSDTTDTTIIIDPPLEPVGSLEFKSLVAAWKRTIIEVKWSTKDEVDIEGYVVKRSVNGGEAVEVASYLTDPTLVAQSGISTLKYDFIDANVMASNIYSYTIEAIDIVGYAFPYGPVEVIGDAVVESAYPNPYNPSFVIPFELFSTQNVDIKLYDMSGRAVRNIAVGNHSAGHYEYRVDCNDLSSGVYILRTVINENPSSQKMLL
ncbi:MAG: T9SS type A sorting domain-containing protein, partial [Candidatus Marinimicrobia bacterium]|nr:T9SS type A sorting domain-containing protein [Candidatus Neomarinimicrobiota bacterium]